MAIGGIAWELCSRRAFVGQRELGAGQPLKVLPPNTLIENTNILISSDPLQLPLALFGRWGFNAVETIY